MTISTLRTIEICPGVQLGSLADFNNFSAESLKANVFLSISKSEFVFWF